MCIYIYIYPSLRRHVKERWLPLDLCLAWTPFVCTQALLNIGSRSLMVSIWDVFMASHGLPQDGLNGGQFAMWICIWPFKLMMKWYRSWPNTFWTSIHTIHILLTIFPASCYGQAVWEQRLWSGDCTNVWGSVWPFVQKWKMIEAVCKLKKMFHHQVKLKVTLKPWRAMTSLTLKSWLVRPAPHSVQLPVASVFSNLMLVALLWVPLFGLLLVAQVQLSQPHLVRILWIEMVTVMHKTETGLDWKVS